MRRWPRGVRKDRVDVWLKDAAPSLELLHSYNRGGLGWDDFAARYRTEILEDRREVLDELRRLAREHGQVTLLCHERLAPDKHCHRLILLELLKA